MYNFLDIKKYNMKTSIHSLRTAVVAFVVILTTIGINNDVIAQCSRTTCNYLGDPAGATTSWQTVSGSVPDGTTYNRYDFSLTVGKTYEFSLCTADGGAASYDSYLCLYQGYGCGMTSPVATNDDFCGSQSKITYTVTSGGWHSLYVSG